MCEFYDSFNEIKNYAEVNGDVHFVLCFTRVELHFLKGDIIEIKKRL